MKRIILKWLAEVVGEPSLEYLAISSVHFVALAFVLTALYGLWRVRRSGLSVKTALLAIGAAGFGALWWGNWVALAFNPERVAKNPMTLVIFIDGGFSSIGAYAGATACLVLFLKYAGKPIWSYADALAPGLLLGSGLARLGCLWSGCDFGRVAPGLPWGIRYPRGTAAFRHLDDIGLVGAYQRVGLPMHPFPLYEAVPMLVAFVVLVIRPGLLGRVSGQTAAGCAVIYCLARLIAEIFRAHTPVVWGRFTVLQALCVVGIALFGAFWWNLRKQGESARPKHEELDEAEDAADGGDALSGGGGA